MDSKERSRMIPMLGRDTGFEWPLSRLCWLYVCNVIYICVLLLSWNCVRCGWRSEKHADSHTLLTTLRMWGCKSRWPSHMRHCDGRWLGLRMSSQAFLVVQEVVTISQQWTYCPNFKAMKRFRPSWAQFSFASCGTGAWHRSCMCLNSYLVDCSCTSGFTFSMNISSCHSWHGASGQLSCVSLSQLS